MQTAATESMYPVMGAIKWERTYHAMLATPLRVIDVLVGHLTWIGVRLSLVSGLFLSAMAGFGAVHSWWAVASLPAAVLTGLAFAAPLAAFSATQDRDLGFSLIFRFAVIPMFLFSGTFFPVTQLPGPLQPVAYATPLWHGVDLCRRLALGRLDAPLMLANAGYLLVLVVAGAAVARIAYRRRLEP
jgi:lipooligosaccharide transport system permease protein